MDEDDAVDDADIGDDEDDDEKLTMGMGGDAESPWNVLKANVDLLVERGFDKFAISQCLFVLTRSRAELAALCDLHAKLNPDKIGGMTIDDQKMLLNLVAYYAEKKTDLNASVDERKLKSGSDPLF